MSDHPPLFPIPDEDPAFGLTARDFLSQAFKHWRTVVLCVVLVSALTWSALWVQPPVYEASAKVWVQTEQQGTPSFLSGIAAYRESQLPDPVDRKIETEVQLLLSRSNVEAVVKSLGITQAQLVQSPLANLKAALPAWMRSSKPKTPAQINREIVALFEKGITVEPVRSKAAETSSNVIQARFECVDRALAPRALAALMQQYIHFEAQHNRELGESTQRLVEAKIREQTEELRRLDDDILQLNLRLAAAPGADLDLNRAAPDAAVTGSRNGAPSSLALLKSATIEMQSKLEEAQQLYTEDSPNVQHLKRQLQQLRERLSAGVHASAELDARLERLDRQRVLALERFTELRKKRDQLDLYLQLDSVEADSRLVTETPVPPDKAKVKVMIVVGLLGPLGGLMLGLMIAGFREYFDHRLQSAQDVKRYLGLETLGIIPKLGFETTP